MNKLLSIIFSSLLLFTILITSCEPNDLRTACINGVVTDIETGEPIKSVGVELFPLGIKTITGNDGCFTFSNLKEGNYQIYTTHVNYVDANNNVEITREKQLKLMILMEKKNLSLRIINDAREEIKEIDFGSSSTDILRSFNLFNGISETLDWEITYTSRWIKSISKINGELKPGRVQSLILTIDRELLEKGENTTFLRITCNGIENQLLIKAFNDIEYKNPILSTLDVTNVSYKNGSAVLNATVQAEGNPMYTERGFVYSTNRNPNIITGNKLQVQGAGIGEFNGELLNIDFSKIYYIRSYATNKLGTYYGNEVVLDISAMLPKVETKEVSVKGNSEIYLEGVILNKGEPKFIECGFLYSMKEEPVIEDVNVQKIVLDPKSSIFNTELSISLGEDIWYIRAYAISEVGVVYGEILKAISPEFFEYLNLPTFTFNNEVYRIYPTLSKMTFSYAEQTCRELNVNGFSDWELPSERMLFYYFKNTEAVEDISIEQYYWTSTEYFTPMIEGEEAVFSHAVILEYIDDDGFRSVNAMPKLKKEEFLVRCVRKESQL